MSSRRDELPTIDLPTLSRVTGGASTDLSAMMLPLMMWKNSQRQQAAAPAPAPAPAAPQKPQILLNGVPQTPSSVSSAGTNYTTPDFFADDF